MEQKKTRIWFWIQAMGEIMVVSIFSYSLRRFLFGGTSSFGDVIWYIMILTIFRHRWEKRLSIDVSRGWCFYFYSFIGTICLGIGHWFGERFYDCPPSFQNLALMLISIFVAIWYFILVLTMYERKARKTQSRTEWLRKRGHEINSQMRILHEERERNAAEYGQLIGDVYRVVPLMPEEAAMASEDVDAPIAARASGNTREHKGT